MPAFQSPQFGEINGPSDIEPLKTGQLLELYNELTNDKIKRFSDRTTAVTRCNKALATWKSQQKDAPKPPEIATSELKSYRPESGRGKIIALASKAGGAKFSDLKRVTKWGDSDLKQALARISDYNGLTVTVEGEGDDAIITVAGVLRTRKPFEFDPAKEQRPARPGSKRARVLEMLQKGATFQEIQEAIEWDERTTYEGIRLINGWLGWGLRETPDGKITAYAA